MAGGRPSSYNESFCEKIITLGKLGYSQAEMAAEIGVAKSTFFLWAKEHEGFSDAISVARTNSQAWWERKGREDLNADKFQAAVYNKRIAGMFPDDYMDKNKTDVTSNGESIKQDNAALNAVIASLAAKHDKIND